MKPLVGISCCTKLFGVFGMPNHAASDTYVRAVDEVVGGVPVLLHQAYGQVELFTGCPAPRATMAAALGAPELT